jgi:hypothetical protein
MAAKDLSPGRKPAVFGQYDDKPLHGSIAKRERDSAKRQGGAERELDTAKHQELFNDAKPPLMPAKRSLLIGTFVFEQTAPALAPRGHPRLT